MDKPVFQTLRMKITDTKPPSRRGADRDWKGRPDPVIIRRGEIDEGGEAGRQKIGELDFGDGTKSVDRRADRLADDCRLGEGGVSNTHRPELRQEILRNAEDSAIRGVNPTEVRKTLHRRDDSIEKQDDSS